MVQSVFGPWFDSKFEYQLMLPPLLFVNMWVFLGFSENMSLSVKECVHGAL